ncbi:MAG: hybrid sensor histidine kinase/response regulator [Anaerolineae bacterium]
MPVTARKVLYIEDNFSNRMLVRRILEAEGYIVLEAEDGLSGIKIAQEERPDLILMDINIPGMDGYETTTKIKNIPELKSIPIVALTAKVMGGDREMALIAGCDGYIQKPIDVERLPRQIEEFLGGKREMVTGVEERFYLREYSQKLVDRLEEKIAELTRANEELRKTDRLKSQFISIAAHELKTPLTVIQGYLGMFLSSEMRAQMDERMKEVTNGIARGVERLNNIVMDMIDITRIEAGKLQLRLSPTNLKSVISLAVGRMKPFAEQRNQQLTVGNLEGLPPVRADGERLQQVLVNLISNGIKFTPDGGHIHVEARLVKGESRTRLRQPTPPRQDFVEIIVEDTGIGIDEEEQQHIFDRFYEVKDASRHSTSKVEFMGSGIGLGLSIARGIVEAHGGWIWVESEGYDEEKCPGSRFHVLIPAEPAS